MAIKRSKAATESLKRKGATFDDAGEITNLDDKGNIKATTAPKTTSPDRFNKEGKIGLPNKVTAPTTDLTLDPLAAKALMGGDISDKGTQTAQEGVIKEDVSSEVPTLDVPDTTTDTIDSTTITAPDTTEDVTDTTEGFEDRDTLQDKIDDLERRIEEGEFIAGGQKEVEDQIKAYQDKQERIDYENEQKEISDQYTSITGEIEDMQSSARLKANKFQVDSLKKNLAYIGTLGKPGVSSAKLDAVSRQIEDAEKIYSDLVKTEGLIKSARALGLESKAKRFERQMDILQQDLDDNVKSTIQSALQDLSRAEIDGVLDSEEEIEKMRISLLDNLDRSVSEITEANFRKRKYVLDQFQQIAADRVSQEKGANTINKEMSEAQGYFIDGNGDAIISSTTGQRIPMDTEPPMKPVFQDGKLVTFSLDANGNIKADVQQVIEEATFSESVISGVVNNIKTGKFDRSDVEAINPSLLQNESIIGAFGDVETSEVPDIETVFIDGEKVSGTRDSDTGVFTPLSIAEGDDEITSYQTEDGTTITASKGTIEGLNSVMSTNPDITFDLRNLYRTQEDQLKLYGQGRTSEELVAEGIDGKYAQPELPKVTETTQSLHMKGNAVDVVLPEGEDKVAYYEGIDKEMADAGFFRPEGTKAMGDYGHYEFKGKEKPLFAQEVQDWGDNIMKGKAKLSDISGNPELKTQVSSYIANTPVTFEKNDPIILGLQEDKVAADTLSAPENDSLAEDVSGGFQFSPWDSLTDKKQQYLRKIQFVLDGQALQNLIDIKSQGGTFGALSDREMSILQKSASLLNSSANRDDEGNITGFTMAEDEFKAGLKDLAKKYDNMINSMLSEDTKEVDSKGDSDPLGLGTGGTEEDPLGLLN